MKTQSFISRDQAVALENPREWETLSLFAISLIMAFTLLLGSAAWAGPIIEVFDQTDAVTNGTQKPIEFDGLVSVYDTTAAGPPPATDPASYAPSTLNKTLTIKNTGDSPLLLNDITVISSYPVGTFTAGTFPPSIAAGASADITVTFNPATAKVDIATLGDAVPVQIKGKLQIFNNQIDRTPFVFPIEAWISDENPHIQVFDGTVDITSKDLAAPTAPALVTSQSGDAPAATMNTSIGQSISKTFTIRNIGADGLLNDTTAITINGVVAGDEAEFEASNFNPALTTAGLASGETATFDITLKAANASIPADNPFEIEISFTPTNAKISTTVPFKVDDEPFNFKIDGYVAPQPEIQVSDATGVILHDPEGTNDPRDFGSHTVGGSAVVKTFTIENLGTADLTLSNPITLNAEGGFSLVSSSFTTTTVAPGNSTTFDVQLDTTTIGTYEGTISFANNDADGGDGVETPFTFSIKGVVASGPKPEIEIWQVQPDGSKTSITDGQIDWVSFDALVGTTPLPTQTFEIKNTGGSPLELTSLNPLPSGFSLEGFFPESIAVGDSGSFTIKLNDTSVEATYQGEVQIFSDDGDNDGVIENPFNFPIRGIVRAPAPEIEVLEGTTDLADGSASIDFGTTNTGTPVSKLFTIKNSGEIDLTLTPPTVPDGFSISGTFPSVVPAAGMATFTLQLDAINAGNYSGEITFANNDSDENPFNFNVSGVVDATTPATQEIEVWFGPPSDIPASATPITDGTTTAPGTAIDFGNTPVGTELVKTFTVRNLGLTDLFIFGNNAPDGFEVVGTLTPIVPAQGEITFQVRLDPTTAGVYGGTFQLFNNDITETPFDFPISGTVGSVSTTSPAIQVLDGTKEVVDGTTTVDFGTTTVSTNVTKTFTVKNIGGADLNLINDVTFTGTGFTVESYTSPLTIASGESETFQVSLNAIAKGTFEGTVSFDNDDPGKNPFDFSVTGIVGGDTTVEVPEIEVVEGTTDILDGTSVDFGTHQVGASVIKTFMIKNVGTADLTLTSDVTFTGAGFSVTSFTSPKTLAPGEEVTFQVNLDTQEAGNFSGNLSFENDDSDEDPFNFTLSGVVEEQQVSSVQEIQVFDGETELVDGATTPIDFGTTTIGNPMTKTFKVKNAGTAVLDLYGYSLPNGFSMVSVYPDSLGVGEEFTFEIQLNTFAEGNFSGAFKLYSTDADENPFDFVISGTVTKEGDPTTMAPEIQVLDGETDIIGGTDTSIDFGVAPLGTPMTKTFTVKNTGDANLTLTSNVTFTTDGSGFSGTSFAAPLTLAPAETVTFDVTLEAQSEGEFFGILSFGNNDSDENPFEFPVSGRVSQVSAEEKACFDGENGLMNGGCIPADTLTAASSSGEPISTGMKGGISKYASGMYDNFKKLDTVQVNQPIITAGVMKVDSKHVGKKVDIIVAGLYTSDFFSKGFMWYMLVSCKSCPGGWTVKELAHDETTLIPLFTKPELLPLGTVDKLPLYYTVDMYTGILPVAGTLDLYFGYRVEEGEDQGKVFFNGDPIDVQIDNLPTP